jgi:hypothetical protein
VLSLSSEDRDELLIQVSERLDADRKRLSAQVACSYLLLRRRLVSRASQSRQARRRLSSSVPLHRQSTGSLQPRPERRGRAGPARASQRKRQVPILVSRSSPAHAAGATLSALCAKPIPGASAPVLSSPPAASDDRASGPVEAVSSFRHPSRRAEGEAAQAVPRAVRARGRAATSCRRHSLQHAQLCLDGLLAPLAAGHSDPI